MFSNGVLWEVCRWIGVDGLFALLRFLYNRHQPHLHDRKH